MKTLNKEQTQELNEIFNNLSNVVETSKDFIFNLKIEDLDFKNFFNDNVKDNKDIELIISHVLDWLTIDDLTAIKSHKDFYFQGKDRGAYKRKAMLLDRLNKLEKKELRDYMTCYN